MGENLKNVTKTMEILKDNMFSKMGMLDGNMSELNKRMSGTVEAFNEHSLSVNDALDKEFNRLEKVTTKYEELMNKGMKDMYDKIEFLNEGQEVWKKDFEEKNHNFFKELTIALKTLKKQHIKEKVDSQEKIDKLKKEMDSAHNLNEEMIARLDKKANHIEKNMEYRLEETSKTLETNFGNEFSKILDEMSKNTDNLSNELKHSVWVTTSDLKDKLETGQKLESARLGDLVLQNKRKTQDEFNEKMKDLENKLGNTWAETFDSYKHQLDDSLRDLNSLKTELFMIKTEHENGMKNVQQTLEDKFMTDIIIVKDEIFDKMRDTKKEIQDDTERLLVNLKGESEHGKTELEKAVEQSKEAMRLETTNVKKELESAAKDSIQNIEGDLNKRFIGIQSGIDLTKRMLMDRMDEMNEQAKSIARAIGLEEAAERAKQDEHIIKLFDRKVDNMDKYLTAKIEQDIDSQRILMEERFKEFNEEFEDFKRGNTDEFRKVRNELEEYKQEVYIKDYMDYLMNTENDKEIGVCFKEINMWLINHDLELEKIKDEAASATNDFDDQMKKEIRIRTAKDKEISLRVKKHIEAYDEYKDLAERTFQEMLNEYETQFYVLRLNETIVEQTIYDIINRCFGSVGNVDGDVKSLRRILMATKKELTIHKKDYVKVTKDHNGRIEDLDEFTSDMDEGLTAFEEKTEKNLRIAEQALFQMNNFLQVIDSRLTTEELMGKICMPEMQEQCQNMIFILQEEQNLKIMNEEEERIEAIEELEKKVITEIVPEEIAKISDELNSMKSGTDGAFKEIQKNMEER